MIKFMSKEQQMEEWCEEMLWFTPFWTDGCEHHKSEYVCSFREQSWFNSEEHKRVVSTRRFDLYVFKDRNEQHICLRYGNEGCEYCSPGDVVEFMQRQGGKDVSMFGDAYAATAWILRRFGKLEFTWRELP